MIRPYVIPIWKKAPFIRLLLPLIAGILLQWYLSIEVDIIGVCLVSFSIAFGLFLLLPLAARYKFRVLQGIILQLLFLSIGMLVTWNKDIRNSKDWYGNYYQNDDYLVVRISEPLTEKPKSYKADGYVEAIIKNGKDVPCKGKILLYFSKDSIKNQLAYGDRIIIHKDLQPIKNSGNPGAFNYQRYAGFQGIFHNVFLKQNDWNEIEGRKINPFWQFVYSTRAYFISILQQTIVTGKDELGIAQALLIGYTNDLDKDLVQAYSNTGVVHIIAISGMHLALIYVLLIWIFGKIPLINKSKLTQVVLVLVCLWIFSILTGASSSVLRAAVMFTFIEIGKNLNRRQSIYSSLTASAFILLCINPYYLWAVGFQLSYLAVLGIVIFQKPIYNIFYIKNKRIDYVWQLISVSTAAQVLTSPVAIYYFHQFPNLFLITNLVAVPLSSVILYAAIALVSFSWIPYVGLYLGKLVGGLTWCMNKFILWVNSFSFAVWDKIPASVASTWLLYALVIGFSAWLINKNKNYFKLGLMGLLAFVILRAVVKWQVFNQQKIIIYNVPQHQAIDFIAGNNYRFVGDSILLEDGLQQNFYLKPARISMDLQNLTDSISHCFNKDIFYQFTNKTIAIVNSRFSVDSIVSKIDLDFVVISKNADVSIAQLTAAFNCKNIIFDASNSNWKIEKWKKECSALNASYYSIPEEGAFVYNIGM
jgi:competence protein ComEC